ncbi:MAG: sensor histidine kinase, partial [Deltaproteobacteria bacterium]|nr:sensor histidine kinase [Deltaproteobacteria bacterium]
SGVGLGLAISDAILARHDGSLEIERLPEGGTRVTVRVPSRPDATGRGAAREAAAV